MTVTEQIAMLGDRPWLAADLLGRDCSRVGQIIAGAESLDDLPGLLGQETVQELIAWAENQIRDREESRKSRRISRLALKAGRSACYLNIHTLQYYITAAGKTRWIYVTDTRGKGLLQGIVDNLGKGVQAPVAIPLLNNRSREETEEGQEGSAGIPWSQIENLWNHDLYVIQGKWALQARGPGWDRLKEMFPNAVDTTAYAGGLFSPTEPGGLWLDIPVTFANIPTAGGRPSGRDGSGIIHPRLLEPLQRRTATVQIRGTTPNGTFFKGICNPDERAVNWRAATEEESRRWIELLPGLVDKTRQEIQETLWEEFGAVAKRRTQDGLQLAIPAIITDWAQVKGKMKAQAKRYSARNARVTTQASVGILRVWDRPSTIHWCFEVKENIQDTPRNWGIVKGFLDQHMDHLESRGLDGIVRSTARDNPAAALCYKFLTILRDKGLNYSPMSIPWMRRAVEDKLQRRLYHLAQGAGMSGARYVTVIDNGVPPGKCVISGVRVGTEVACFRIPAVLSQVLTVVEATQPLPWHRTGTGVFECQEWMRVYEKMLEVQPTNQALADYLQGQLIQLWHDGIEAGRYSEGDPIPYTVFLNQRDMVNRMMGDDDGDTIGVSTDPLVVELFRSLVDDKVCLVEPEGKKVQLLWDDPRGWEEYRQTPQAYMATNQQGPVGELTILRSRLLAAGDIMGARAMSILIQEAIDKAKRVVEWSDWRFAVYEDNWLWNESKQGWEFKPISVVEFEDSEGRRQRPRSRIQTDDRGNIRMPQVYGWVNERLKAHGVPVTTSVDDQGRTREKPVYTCGWRRGRWESDKRINPDEWEPAEAYQDGWRGGNLVHRTWNHARERFMRMKEKFDLNFDQADLSNLVAEVLWHQAGIRWTPTPMTWDEYQQGLRRRSGVQELGQKMAKAQATKESELRQQRIDEALRGFTETVQHCTQDELCQIWYMECTHSRHQESDTKLWGNINYAYYAIAWEGSPILQLLGMESAQTCRFLDQGDNLTQALNWCFRGEPISRLQELLERATRHGQEIKDESGEPVPLWACPDCVDRLQRGVIMRIRRDKSRDDRVWMSRLTHELNKNPD